jgi:bis(5'-nucleosidyl)-tetraphosphatase
MMLIEKSAGVVVFRKTNSGNEYLVLKYGIRHWDFPKGHLEENETSLEAALRETYEETGLKVNIVNGFNDKITYIFRTNYSEGQVIYKEVDFFLGQIDISANVKLSHEHSKFKWEKYDKAMKTLTYQNARNILTKANEFAKNL